jgi:hypothetical protein
MTHPFRLPPPATEDELMAMGIKGECPGGDELAKRALVIGIENLELEDQIRMAELARG